MSRLIDALDKVQETRQHQSRTVIRPAISLPADSVKHDSFGTGGAIPSILLVIVAVVSVGVNIKTIVELNDMRQSMSSAMARYTGEQTKELAGLRESLERTEALKEKQGKQIVEMEESLKNIKASVETFKSAAAKIEDLKVNDKLLLEKFVALNDQVRKMNAVNSKQFTINR